MRDFRAVAVRAARTLALLVLLFSGVGRHALQAAEDLATRRARALDSFAAVLRADEEITARTRADLEAVLAAEPEDALARVHLGWLLVRQAWLKPLSEARELATAGCAMMDAAVAAQPDDPAVRLVRARSDSQLPLALGREPIATQDFAMLVDAAQRTGDGSLAPELRRQIFFHAGAHALRLRRTEEAVRLLDAAAAVFAPEPEDAVVQSMLALARHELSSQSHAEDARPHQVPPAAP